MVVGSVFYAVAFIALFNILSQKTPRYIVGGKLIALYGCVCGGTAFGLRDIFMDMFSIPHAQMMQALATHSTMANVIFWIGGPAFPVSMLLLGIVGSSKRLVPVWVGILLTLGGVLFPLSRILRAEMLAHLVDALFLVPLWYIAAHLKTEGEHVVCTLSA